LKEKGISIYVSNNLLLVSYFMYVSNSLSFVFFYRISKMTAQFPLEQVELNNLIITRYNFLGTLIYVCISMYVLQPYSRVTDNLRRSPLTQLDFYVRGGVF